MIPMMGISVRLKSIDISNYRSCISTHFETNTALSALIGPNGSGKTNILQAILLLKKISSFRPGHRTSRNLERASTCSLRCSFEVIEGEITYSARIKYITNEFNNDELVDTEEHWEIHWSNGTSEQLSYPLAVVRAPAQDSYFMWIEHMARLEQKKRLEAGDKKATSASLSDLLGEKLEDIERQVSAESPSRRALGRIASFISKISYYSASQFTSPADCPAFFEIESENVFPRRFGSQRTSHSRFLKDLYSLKQNNKAGFGEYERLVGESGINLIEKLEFHRVELPSSDIEIRTGGEIVKKQIKRMLIVPHFIINGTKLSPAQLSEGTFKTLAVVLYLATDKSDLLLLEEPEVCIHHGLLSSLIELIKSYSGQKQIILTTHSDYVLDELVPENILLVKNTKELGTVVGSLPESLSSENYSALKGYLDTTGNLGEYWKHMGFEDA